MRFASGQVSIGWGFGGPAATSWSMMRLRPRFRWLLSHRSWSPPSSMGDVTESNADRLWWIGSKRRAISRTRGRPTIVSVALSLKPDDFQVEDTLRLTSHPVLFTDVIVSALCSRGHGAVWNRSRIVLRSRHVMYIYGDGWSRPVVAIVLRAEVASGPPDRVLSWSLEGGGEAGRGAGRRGGEGGGRNADERKKKKEGNRPPRTARAANTRADRGARGGDALARRVRRRVRARDPGKCRCRL